MPDCGKFLNPGEIYLNNIKETVFPKVYCNDKKLYFS